MAGGDEPDLSAARGNRPPSSDLLDAVEAARTKHTLSDLSSPPSASGTIASSPHSSSYVGRRLGQYTLLEKIGQGGMGSVFKAFDTLLERTVALKVMLSGPLEDRKQCERFLREARSLARLNHPNLLHIYNVGAENDCHYFAMEILNGETLSSAIQRRRRIPAEELLPYVAQLLSALHYVHQQGITHRDIKSGNIMLCGRRAVLMDFGLAKDENTSGLTSAGQILGTPDYMPPEAADGICAGPPSDIYSLGVVLYEALSGVLPFGGRSAMSIIRQHIETAPPRIETAIPGIHPLLASIVHKCLEKKPADRYADCPSLAADLVRVQAEPELIQLSTDSDPTAPTVARSRGPSPSPDEIGPADDTLPGTLGPSSGTVTMMPAAAAQILDVPDATLPADYSAMSTVISREQAAAIRHPDERRAWPQWIWVAAGFFSVFIGVILIAGAKKRAAEREETEGSAAPTVLKKSADGEKKETLRWVEFKGGADPSAWVHVIEKRGDDGRWVRSTISHAEFLDGKESGRLEFVQGADARRQP